MQVLGREPQPEELSESLEIPLEKVRMVLRIANDPISLETPVGEEDDGRLSDFIGPGQTLIFELGCNGPRELTPGAGRGTGTDEYTQPPWLSCANRRVQCIHGFINKNEI